MTDLLKTLREAELLPEAEPLREAQLLPEVIPSSSSSSQELSTKKKKSMRTSVNAPIPALFAAATARVA